MDFRRAIVGGDMRPSSVTSNQTRPIEDMRPASITTSREVARRVSMRAYPSRDTTKHIRNRPHLPATAASRGNAAPVQSGGDLSQGFCTGGLSLANGGRDGTSVP
jgi:hypothetical protein